MEFRAILAAVALLAGTGAAAAAPDGAVAPAWRWSDPRGTVSGSRRSDAIPITRGVEEAWSVKFEAGPVVAPPVTWDGRVYVLAGTAKQGTTLYAVDLQDGEILGDRGLRCSVETQPCVWDGLVYLRTAADCIQAYRLSGGRLTSTWSHRVDTALGEPVVFEGDLYFGVAAPDDRDGAQLPRLRKVREGSMVPVWESETMHPIVSRPSIRGECVYVLGEGDGFLTFHTMKRSDASWVQWGGITRLVPGGQGYGTEPEIMVVANQAVVSSHLPLASVAGPRSHVILPCESPGSGPRFDVEQCGLVDMLAPPAMHADGVLALGVAEEVFLGIWKDRGASILATQGESPDLFGSKVPATVLGDVVYFGTWAADIKTLQILWRLPVPGVLFGAVPADGLVIVVDGEGVLRAYRERRHP